MLHRRVVRDVYAAGSSDHRIHYYFNESWQLLEERQEVSSTLDADPLNQYIWHPYYIDALAVRIYDADTDGNYAENADGLYYYQHDANFNVTAVTNSSGSVVERYKYTPYGQVTVLDANFANDSDGISDIGNTHFYTGRELDPETGLQLNRNRFYANQLGRWVTRDPIGYFSGSNLYSYVSARPTLYVDPLGLVPPAAAAVGSALSTASTVITYVDLFDTLGTVNSKESLKCGGSVTQSFEISDLIQDFSGDEWDDFFDFSDIPTTMPTGGPPLAMIRPNAIQFSWQLTVGEDDPLFNDTFFNHTVAKPPVSADNARKQT